MTEEQIERRVERRTDAIDRHYMAGEFDEAEYRRQMTELDQWANGQFDQLAYTNLFQA